MDWNPHFDFQDESRWPPQTHPLHSMFHGTRLRDSSDEWNYKKALEYGELCRREILWCCHIRGPDDIHAAPDYETALKWADTICALNWRGRGGKNNPPKSFEECLLKAVPAIWPWSAERHAADLPKSIADFTPRTVLSFPGDPDLELMKDDRGD